MQQATNELILGIELNREYSQMTYYHQSVREPMTLGGTTDKEQCLMPMGLRRDSNGFWHFWDGSAETGKEDDLFQIPDLAAKIDPQEIFEYREQTMEPAEAFTEYFRIWFGKLEMLTREAEIHVMVSVRELTEQWSELIVAALEKNGIPRRQIYLQDYLSSFYYYAVNQKRELWFQDVAMIEHEGESLVGYVLHIDRGTRPAIAKVDLAARQEVSENIRGSLGDSEWNKEKDRLFFELLKKVFERRNVSVSYLVGDYFDQSWAKKSIQFLCHKRHAFQGMNLYSKGACYAGMERAGLIAGREIVFSGNDMIERNISMEMRIRGKDSFYPMISAGINWYEAHHVCEFVLNNEKEIRVISHPMAQGDTVVHTLRLKGLPERPNRGTRIRLTVYFSSPSVCHIEAEDMGFGGLYKSSGLVWKRMLCF